MAVWLQEIDEALAEHNLKRAEMAIAKTIKASLLPSEKAALLYRRAQIRVLDGRPDDSLDDLNAALALEPALSSQPKTYTLLGDIYFTRFELAKVGFANREDIQEALQHYQSLLTQITAKGEVARAYYQLGRIHLMLGQPKEAEQHFRRVLEHPSQPHYLHSMTYERLGFIALFELRTPKDAVPLFYQALRTIPEGSHNPQWIIQLRLRLSRAYVELDQAMLAVAQARQALQEAVEYSNLSATLLPETYLATADVMSLLVGFEEEAIEHYLKFLQFSEKPPGIDVTWSRVYEQIGMLSLRLARTHQSSSNHFKKTLHQAIHAFEKAIQSNPYHPWEGALTYQIAQCYYRLHQFDRALNVLGAWEMKDQQEAVFPNDWRIPSLKGHAYFALEQYPQAISAYRLALDLVSSKLHNTETIRTYLHYAEQLANLANE